MQLADASPAKSDRWMLVAAVLVGLSALIYRRPDAFTMPWFYGEEGRDFYAQAWNEGWASMLHRANGYFHLYPRLIANLSVTLAVPVAMVPWVNLAFVLLMMGLVWALTWTRFPGPPLARACAVAAITLVPLGNEIWMTMTNIQWPMALVIVLLLVDQPRECSWSSAVLLLICGLTGPNALVLCPIAAWRIWSLRHGPKEAWAPGLIVLACGLVSALSLLHHGHVARTDGVFSPSDTGFVQAAFFQLWFPILGKCVHEVGPLLQALLVLAAIAALGVLWRRRARESGPSSQLLLAALLFFIAAMVAYRGEPGFLSPYYAGIRNFYLPALLLAWSLLSSANWKSTLTPVASTLVLAWWLAQAMLFVGPKRFREAPMQAEVDPLRRNEAVEVPIDPPGWTMRLQPRGPSR